MGRKIPSRKHKGVVDPLIQKKHREELLGKVVNAPPTSLDQPIPKSMHDFMRLKQIGQRAMSRKDRKKKDPDGAFVRNLQKEDKGRAKGQFKSNPKKKKNTVGNSGESEVVREHREKQQWDTFDGSDDELIDRTHGKLKWKNGLERRNKKIVPGVEPKKKVDRRVEKRKKLLEKKREKMEEKAQLKKKDTVAFGEVVHEPPSMRIKPKYASTNDRQMGLKDLHLKRLLMKGAVAPVAMVSATTAVKSRSRLRDLSARERTEVERKQQDAIAAYRLIKAKNNAASKER